MTITAVFLVIISAVMHASWNIFSKSQSPTIGFFQLATIGTVFWFSPIFFISADLIINIPIALWGILIAAGLFQAIYYTGLAGAYARGALSITYPLARSFPLFFIIILTFAIGRGSDLSSLALFGILTIIAGAIILPMNSFSDFRFANYLNVPCAFALVAAAGTAGYSLADDIGMNMLKHIPNDAAGWMRALVYLVLECVFTAVWLQLLMQCIPKSTAHFRANRRRMLKPAFLAGLAIGVTYGIILLAMTHAQNVSYVVGLRQLSIPIGTIMGILIFKEKGSLPRFVGVCTLFTGLFLVAVG
ncbi:MAG: multidrug DMT transporter permease [Desulforhopalus sp.]|nr:multidrug DMT transporter permease [Desulforhopalus sp.]